MAYGPGFDESPVVAVIGGGFSGLLTALHLLRGDPGLRVRLIERRRRLGEGRAYGAKDLEHLLNVRAANMSALPDQPDHFVRWLGQDVSSDAFVSRSRYADYLRALLADTRWETGPRLAAVRAEALQAWPDGANWRVGLSSGEIVRADAVVLAVGFLGATWPAAVELHDASGPAFIVDPWSVDLGAAPRGDILLLGTGLTMVDITLSLAHPQRRLTALSRRGLAPLGHGAAPPAAAPAGSLARPTDVVRALRAHAADVGWRSAIDSIRSQTPAIWRHWPIAERRRFLRHLQPWWDIHRHRMAPTIAARIEALRASGCLTVEAGRLQVLRAVDGGVQATIRPRGGGEAITRRFAAVLNCASPCSDPRSQDDGLIADLYRRGRLRADPLGLGVEVDDNLRVIAQDGRPSAGLYAVGPLTRGALWEAVAVPDLRVQTALAAQTVLDDLRRVQPEEAVKRQAVR